ncbi:helix-turn-helix domain-containing protein [Vagococcus carniphilus]|uniref:DNA-binding protein n=1 Tax=Vagococcus carniphilus TaxID=218144 RepID=A0A430AP93_9ENTE|nr:helix-turn-helix domain-containing protein [Vagococcus carniphilus]MDT2849462.1 helix-turn-helix domain-containing protein [Vagococcus carniphilus]MDT2864201.1 helix-turn-helix domain-containing protein [Vagococcus carniphilus]QNN72610.1 helix-turn-helix domain-containing protein [Vagococcus carniphilus]RSU09724.1 DNA-binding protein [Vagococcus carniphilus]
MDTVNVGNQITKFRNEKGYSMRKLAELGEITPSMLSQIERGLANPSIQTLKILSKVLEVPIFYFFLEEQTTDSLITRKDEHKKMIVKDLSYELLSPDLAGELETVIMRVPSGVVSSSEPIGHKGEEIAYVLSGKINLYLDNKLYSLDSGDSVKIPAYMVHKWENIEEEEAKVIFSVTPPTF